jgi:hypothetical protein
MQIKQLKTLLKQSIVVHLVSSTILTLRLAPQADISTTLDLLSHYRCDITPSSQEQTPHCYQHQSMQKSKHAEDKGNTQDTCDNGLCVAEVVYRVCTFAVGLSVQSVHAAISS